MAFIGRRLIISALVLLTAGCAKPQKPQPLPQEHRDSFGRLAVSSINVAPQINIDITRGRSHGAAKAAGAGARGSLGAGLESGDAAGFLVGIVLAPVIAAGGAVYGAMANDSARVVDGYTRPFENYLFGTELQSLLKKAVVDHINLRTLQKVVKTELMGAASFDQPRDYRSESNIDTVLELGMKEINLYDLGVKNARVGLSVAGLARLVKVDNGEVLFSREYQYQSAVRDLAEWGAEGGIMLNQEFQSLIDHVAEKIVDDCFLTSTKFTGRMVSMEGIKPEVERCFFCKDKIEPLDTLQPELCWLAFPAPEDMASPDGAWLQEVEDIVYDLKIRKYKLSLVPEPEVFMVTDLEQTCFQIEAPLEPCQRYVWSVRARYWIDGKEEATIWQGRGNDLFKTSCKGI